MHPLKQAFLDRLETGAFEVGILGMGYVGLSLALAFVERARVKVTGFDVDAERVRAIKSGRSYVMHVGEERVQRARAAGLLDATTNFDELGRPDALLIAVPTPLGPEREPDLGPIESSGDAIARRLRRAQLVVLESTTYPGTTDGKLRAILERSGLESGKDFFLAFSPEREDPGFFGFETTAIPKVIGGVDADSTDVAAALYARAFERVERVSSARVAEASKLVENIFGA